MKNIITSTIFLVLLSCAHKSPQKFPEQRSFELMSLAYHHLAAETVALQLQAYNVAKDQLRLALSKKINKPKAVILDIDETILDNVPYQIRANVEGLQFPTGWSEWIQSAQAKVIPGAKDFIDFAQKNDVEVFLITNRNELEKNATLLNLRKKGIIVDDQHLILKADASSKELRREAIAAKYYIAMLIGDNLADFDKLYDKRTLSDRSNSTMKLAEQFGRRYIILPNPMYGDWEGAVFNGIYPKSNDEKNEQLKIIIRGSQFQY